MTEKNSLIIQHKRNKSGAVGDTSQYSYNYDEDGDLSSHQDGDENDSRHLREGKRRSRMPMNALKFLAGRDKSKFQFAEFNLGYRPERKKR